MGKKRIYQLAKELNISSKEVIAAAKERGFSVRNHMSTLGENEERQLRESLRPNQSTKTSKQQASVKKAIISKKINLLFMKQVTREKM